MTQNTSRGLGKGLSVLMSEEYSRTVDAPEESVVGHFLAIDVIVSGKFQPRVRFTQEYLQELADSIRQNGIMQPIVVRPLPNAVDRYEIIAGERRWRAAQLAGLTEVPVIIREVDDRQALELALIENIQRQDLSPLEEAAGYQRLMDEFGYTQEELSAGMGKSRSHVANLLRLLTLPEKIRQWLEEEKISMGHARALVNAPNPELLAEEVIKRGLNVRQTEGLVRSHHSGSGIISKSGSRNASSISRAVSKAKDPDIQALEETLSENLGLKICIEDQGQSGQIIINYDTLSQLDEILKRLGGRV